MSDKRADDGPFWESSNIFFGREYGRLPHAFEAFTEVKCRVFPPPFFFPFWKEDMFGYVFLNTMHLVCRFVSLLTTTSSCFWSKRRYYQTLLDLWE